MKDKQYTAADLIGLLRTKYPLPTWAFVTEVPNATSWDKSRSADALAMGCWKTAGLEMHGFEIKVSRGDWQKELQDLSKAEAFAKHCHRWWIVAAPGCVKLEELPSDWGLMEPVANGLKVRSAANKRTPEPIPYGFLAAIMRRALQSVTDDNALREARRKGFEDGEKHAAGRAERNTELLVAQKELLHLRETIKRFQEASGLTLDNWGAGRIGESVKGFQEMQSQFRSLSRGAEVADKLAESLREFHRVLSPALEPGAVETP